jgi:DNA sulfur modification protein DndC
VLENKVNESIEILKNASRSYSLPWALGFSGGKDSTTALSLTLKAKEEGAEISKLYVIYADTMLEHSFLRKKSLEALESLRAFEWVEPVVVKAREGEDFISMMVDKGYPAPSIFNRWCMARLKIYPVHRFLRQIGKRVMVLGVRSDESARRKATIGTEPLIVKRNEIDVRPLIKWTKFDVFEYLLDTKRWDGKSFDYLFELYGEECGFNPDVPCGTSDVRFGCWVCTLINNEKMPVSETLKKVRVGLKEISSKRENRIIDENGNPRRLNLEGRKKVAELFLEALEKEPEAFGYDVVALKNKLETFLKDAREKTLSF